MEINKNSWHYKIVSKFESQAPKTLCSYWGILLLALAGAASFLFLVLLFLLGTQFMGLKLSLEIDKIGNVFNIPNSLISSKKITNDQYMQLFDVITASPFNFFGSFFLGLMWVVGVLLVFGAVVAIIALTVIGSRGFFNWLKEKAIKLGMCPEIEYKD